MHVYKNVTKPAYELHPRYNSGQSSKLFKIFKQQQMKDDENHLASDYYKKCLPKSASQGAVTPRTQNIKYRAHHSGAVLFMSIHTHKQRANHSSAIHLVGWVKEQTFQIVWDRLVDTSYHYKLNNKHVTEVFTNVWNCLIELEWLEDIACLPWSLRTRMVKDHMKTEHN